MDSNRGPTPSDVKWERNADGTFSKYVYELGRGWVYKGDVPPSEVPASEGGTGPG
jgi:hypothetical protein